jgi:hypothetical protein
MDVNPRAWQSLDKRSRGPGVIEMNVCKQKVRNVFRIEARRTHTSQQCAKSRRCANVHQRQLTLADNQIGGDDLALALKLRVNEPQIIGQLTRHPCLRHPKDSFHASARLLELMATGM